MSRIIVIGGGPAGMMAAIASAEMGNKVILLEHNEKLGKKLFITGKGRCNITNACDTEDLFNNITRNHKFLFSAIYGYDNQAVMDFFEDNGLKIKVERGDRVFPASDHSSDVIKVLEKKLDKAGVGVRLRTHVKNLLLKDNVACGVRLNSGQEIVADAVIIATGGVSYPSTGSDGSGLDMVKEAGHSITNLRPSLIGMRCQEDYVKSLMGLSLKNVSLKIYDGKKKLYEDFGEMLFTHEGISGPLVLTASSKLQDKYFEKNISFNVDLKPALDHDQLDKRVNRDFQENINKQFKNSIDKLLPSKLIPVIIDLSGIDPDKKVHSITKEERRNLVNLIKGFPGTICGLGKMEEAIITRGGVKVKEVDPSTMESKIIQNLYICGEMLDCDAYTGGFNLQIAWSSGHLAGISAGGKTDEF